MSTVLRSSWGRLALAALGGFGIAAVAARRAWRRRNPVAFTSRTWRNAELARTGLGIGADYATTSARKLFASAERRIELDEALQLRSAEQVAARLGQMKGALMKLGQMASYLDDGLPQPVRDALASLQTDAPPMSGELAAEVIATELGAAPTELFVEWDPVPIAAASIGQVHRAVVVDRHTGEERAVAVKVQYPGVAEAIDADLRNTELVGLLLRQGFPGLDPAELVEELRERLTEELDYRLELVNQQRFAEFFHGHPTVRVPAVFPELSSARVLTSELVTGATWAEALTWNQDERNLIGETLFRFVFRSLYRLRAFNGDPHPGNYLFHGDGVVTFLDFGLVRYFTADEIAVFAELVKSAAYDHDDDALRRVVEDAGLLRRGADVSNAEVGDYFKLYYAPSTSATMHWNKRYASEVVRHLFDRNNTLSPHLTVTRSFVLIQRINLGLYALLGDLEAIGPYRAMSEELWPFTADTPSTPIGHAEVDWLAAKADLGRSNP